MKQVTDLPWVEKYRPSCFEDIVLDGLTKELLTKMLEAEKFPNLLLYGPPGTGKTTTVVNLVNEYRKRKNETSSGHVIHLNASDERGIDIVRGPISQFVNSNSLFKQGTKFVILDEADYMTSIAQHALRQLLQSHPNVKFCLICNYVSKVDESLKNEFVRLRFNHLPDNEIEKFLANICEIEKIKVCDGKLAAIRKAFGSDMRSMINYLQSNYSHSQEITIVYECDWQNVYEYIQNKEYNTLKRKLNNIAEMGIGMKNVIRDFTEHIIRSYPNKITSKFLGYIEFIIHIKDVDDSYLLSFFLNNCINHL